MQYGHNADVPTQSLNLENIACILAAILFITSVCLTQALIHGNTALLIHANHGVGIEEISAKFQLPLSTIYHQEIGILWGYIICLLLQIDYSSLK